jgi:hypothetical protein
MASPTTTQSDHARMWESKQNRSSDSFTHQYRHSFSPNVVYIWVIPQKQNRRHRGADNSNIYPTRHWTWQ